MYYTNYTGTIKNNLCESGVPYSNKERAKTKKALRKSIKHWCVDIRRPLINGDVIIGHSFWKNKKEEVKMYSDNCELCRVYDKCRYCPLGSCTHPDSPYELFYAKLNQEAASQMIESLVKCYNEV